jgi:hypothetical protein
MSHPRFYATAELLNEKLSRCVESGMSPEGKRKRAGKKAGEEDAEPMQP